jgi:hypothetical protein
LYNNLGKKKGKMSSSDQNINLYGVGPPRRPLYPQYPASYLNGTLQSRLNNQPLSESQKLANVQQSNPLIVPQHQVRQWVLPSQIGSGPGPNPGQFPFVQYYDSRAATQHSEEFSEEQKIDISSQPKIEPSDSKFPTLESPLLEIFNVNHLDLRTLVHKVQQAQKALAHRSRGFLNDSKNNSNNGENFIFSSASQVSISEGLSTHDVETQVDLLSAELTKLNNELLRNTISSLQLQITEHELTIHELNAKIDASANDNLQNEVAYVDSEEKNLQIQKLHQLITSMNDEITQLKLIKPAELYSGHHRGLFQSDASNTFVDHNDINDDDDDVTELTPESRMALEPMQLIEYIRSRLHIGNPKFAPFQNLLGNALEKLAMDIYSDSSRSVLELLQNADDKT